MLRSIYRSFHTRVSDYSVLYKRIQTEDLTFESASDILNDLSFSVIPIERQADEFKTLLQKLKYHIVAANK